MNQIPDKIDPLRLAKQATVLNGDFEKTQFERLCELLTSTTGRIQVALSFGFDELEKVYIKVGIQTRLDLVCQRCGEPVSCDINVEPKIRPVLSDAEAKSAHKMYDFWVTNGNPIPVLELVEEELLLSLPISARHEEGHCPVEIRRIFS